MKQLLDLGPYVVPALLTVLAGVFGPTLRTAARLRRDLSSDAEVVGALEGEAKDALREDMGRRALILIGYSRYPTLTLSDLLAAIGFLCSAAAWGYACYNFANHGFDLDVWTTTISFAIPLNLLVIAYLTFHRRWSERAGHRIRYLQEKVSEEQARESARLARVAWHFSTLVGFVTTALLPTSLVAAIIKWYGLTADDNRVGMLVVGSGVLAWWLGLRVLRRATRTELDAVMLEFFHKGELEAIQQGERERLKRKAERKANRTAKRNPAAADPQPDPDSQP